MEETTKIEKIGFLEKFGFLVFSVASNIVFAFRGGYYLFFLTDVCRIDVGMSGVILAIGTVWDAVNDPIAGWWSVNHPFKNGEHIRPWALVCSVPMGIALVLVFTNWHLIGAQEAIVALAVFSVFELISTFMNIPYNAMAATATDSIADRRSINVYRNLGGCFGTAIGAVACLPLLKLFGAMDSSGNLIYEASTRGFILTAFVMAVIIIIGSLFHYFTTKERLRPRNAEETQLSMLALLKMLFRSKSFVLNTLFIFLYGASSFLLLTDIVYYCKVVLGSTGDATMIQAVFLVASIVSSFSSAPLIGSSAGQRRWRSAVCLWLSAGSGSYSTPPISTRSIWSPCLWGWG